MRHLNEALNINDPKQVADRIAILRRISIESAGVGEREQAKKLLDKLISSAKAAGTYREPSASQPKSSYSSYSNSSYSRADADDRARALDIARKAFAEASNYVKMQKDLRLLQKWFKNTNPYLPSIIQELALEYFMKMIKEHQRKVEERAKANRKDPEDKISKSWERFDPPPHARTEFGGRSGRDGRFRVTKIEISADRARQLGIPIEPSGFGRNAFFRKESVPDGIMVYQTDRNGDRILLSVRHLNINLTPAIEERDINDFENFLNEKPSAKPEDLNKFRVVFVGHYKDETSDKVWGWGVKGDTIYQFWGRRGGTPSLKTFPKSESNLNEINRLAKAKESKGYRKQPSASFEEWLKKVLQTNPKYAT